MGYTTTFDGQLNIEPAISEDLKNYINRFADTRHMKRNRRYIEQENPNWFNDCYQGELGAEGEFYVGGTSNFGDDMDWSVIDYNVTAGTCPSLWCQWIINDNGGIAWDGYEKFHHYIDWLDYLIRNFLKPNGYIVNGEIKYEGESPDDFGIIVCKDNIVSKREGVETW